MNIIGRLTQDAQVRKVSNDKEVVNFSVATNDNYKNKQGERVEQTTYFECAYWLTTKVAQFLSKGTLVELSGRVSVRSWIGKDGEAHAGLNFHTSNIKFYGGGQGSKSAKAPKEKNGKQPDKGKDDDDLPF
jgi:single-strand DNA-binding protein